MKEPLFLSRFSNTLISVILIFFSFFIKQTLAVTLVTFDGSENDAPMPYFASVDDSITLSNSVTLNSNTVTMKLLGRTLDTITSLTVGAGCIISCENAEDDTKVTMPAIAIASDIPECIQNDTLVLPAY